MREQYLQYSFISLMNTKQLQCFLNSNKMKRVFTQPENLRKQEKKHPQKCKKKYEANKDSQKSSVNKNGQKQKLMNFTNHNSHGYSVDSSRQQEAKYNKKISPRLDQVDFLSENIKKVQEKQPRDFTVNFSSNNLTITKHLNRNTNFKNDCQPNNTQKLTNFFNPRCGNQKLEGWETKKSSSHHFLVDKSGNVCETQQLDHKKLKTIQNNIEERTQSRSSSRNNSIKNKQFETDNFLKEVRLKYAKALKFRENQLQSNCKSIQNCIPDSSPILIQDDNIDKLEPSSENPHHFVKYSQRKTFLNLKKITPDANQHLSSSRNFQIKNQDRWENLEERINHDCLIPRPQSKKRARISPCDLSSSLSKDKYSQKAITNLQQSFRHRTIDSSQIPKRSRQDSINLTNQKRQYIGYNKLKKQRLKEDLKSSRQIGLKSASSNLLGPVDNNNLLLFSNNQPSIQINRRKKLIKIKLKYLKSLKSGHNSHLSNIEPQTLENAKLTQPKANGFRALNAEVSASDLMGKSSPKNLTPRAHEITSGRKKLQQFQKLKKLLQKEQREPVFLICQKQISTLEYQ